MVLPDRQTTCVLFQSIKEHTTFVKAANSDGNGTKRQLSLKSWYFLYGIKRGGLFFICCYIPDSLRLYSASSWCAKVWKPISHGTNGQEHQEEINQMKMRFFTSIYLMNCTPLTLIMAPLQEIISRISDRWTRNQLDYIQRNANRLLYLVIN